VNGQPDGPAALPLEESTSGICWILGCLGSRDGLGVCDQKKNLLLLLKS